MNYLVWGRNGWKSRINMKTTENKEKDGKEKPEGLEIRWDLYLLTRIDNLFHSYQALNTKLFRYAIGVKEIKGSSGNRLTTKQK